MNQPMKKFNLLRGSLLWRIALPYAILILVIMGGVAAYLYFSLRSFYIQQVSERLLAEARVSSADLAVMVAANPLDPAINERALQVAAATGGRVTIVLADGTVVGESDRPIEGMENHLGRPEVQLALDNKEAVRIRYSNTLGEELLYAAVPVVTDGVDGVPGAVLRLAYPLGKLQETINRLMGSIALATALAAALAVALAVWIAGYTLRPLRTLSASVEQVGYGLLPEIGAPRGTDEISQLQAAFRAMYSQLRARFDELRAERGKLEAVLMNMTDGIIMVDVDGIVRLINPAARRLFDVPDGQAEERSLVEVARHHLIVEMWRKCRQSGQVETITLETAAGRSNLQAIATPLGEEMAGSVILVFQDLTRIRRLETVRRDFISNVSHELRTPLASLKALTETLQEGALEDPPAARRFLSQMETEIDNLTQMVRELLELSRIESGRVPLEIKACDPGILAREAAERMRLQAERAGLELLLECADGLPAVQADAVRIEQVLVNLIHNAVKFTPPGGQITVGCFTQYNEAVIFVRDNGVGIDAADLARIFERFYKADRSRSGGGTGLGLSIARRIVESHRGTIWSESQPGQGSTFFFSLPNV
jgi:two-component system phosphate regulon sensor histidine kinase PhoR